jgi:hypothetical protein
VHREGGWLPCACAPSPELDSNGAGNPDNLDYKRQTSATNNWAGGGPLCGTAAGASPSHEPAGVHCPRVSLRQLLPLHEEGASQAGVVQDLSCSQARRGPGRSDPSVPPAALGWQTLPAWRCCPRRPVLLRCCSYSATRRRAMATAARAGDAQGGTHPTATGGTHGLCSPRRRSAPRTAPARGPAGRRRRWGCRCLGR